MAYSRLALFNGWIESDNEIAPKVWELLVIQERGRPSWKKAAERTIEYFYDFELEFKKEETIVKEIMKEFLCKDVCGIIAQYHSNEDNEKIINDAFSKPTAYEVICFFKDMKKDADIGWLDGKYENHWFLDSEEKSKLSWLLD